MDKLEEIMASKRKSLEHIARPIKSKELEALARSKVLVSLLLMHLHHPIDSPS